MSIQLEQDEAISKGIRRIVCKRIDQSLKMLKGKNRAVSDRAIHQVRGRFKEIRSILRLVRDGLGGRTFRRENRVLRDAGRPLSTLRDAKALIDSLDGLIAQFSGRWGASNFSRLRRALLKRRRATRKQVLNRGRALSAIRKNIRAVRKRVKHWSLRNPGWKGIESGLERVYAQGRRVTEDARANTSDKALHEWRKRVKDLRYELEWLQPVCSKAIKPLAERAHQLTNILGEDHDLAVLRTFAKEEYNDDLSIDRESLFALIDKRRGKLQKEAIKLGQKLYEANAREFVGRLKGYSKTTERHCRNA